MRGYKDSKQCIVSPSTTIRDEVLRLIRLKPYSLCPLISSLKVQCLHLVLYQFLFVTSAVLVRVSISPSKHAKWKIVNPELLFVFQNAKIPTRTISVPGRRSKAIVKKNTLIGWWMNAKRHADFVVSQKYPKYFQQFDGYLLEKNLCSRDKS